VDGDTIEQGVRLDKAGRIKGFYIADIDRWGSIRTNATAELDARHAIFVQNPVKRSSQTRGMPHLVSGMSLAQRLDDILTSEAISWQVMSRLAVALTRDKATTRPAIRDGHNAESRSGTETKDLDTLVTEIGPSLIFQAKPGESIEGITQNRPAPNFDESVRLFIRLFGVPLGIPLELIILDYAGLNYSNFRGLLLAAFVNFRMWQRHIVTKFCIPTYRWQVGRAVADGRLAWRPGILNHTWDLPGWPWADLDKEVSGWAKMIDRGLATQTQALGSLSLDPAQQLRDRKAEIKQAWQTAQEIEEETAGGVKATQIWKHLAGLDMGKTESAVKAANGGNDDGDSSDDENPEE
jgi:capsid protein